MDEWEVAASVAFHLEGVETEEWKAEYGGLDEIQVTASDGTKFLLTVERVDAFDAD